MASDKIKLVKSALLFAAIFTAAALPAADASRRRRSDDLGGSALEAIVQEQAATIQSLKADIAAMKSQMTTLESICNTRMNGLNGSLSSLTERVGGFSSQLFMQVGFSAHYSRYTINTGDDSPLRFDAVTTNIGGGYDSSTGIFTAPTAGFYFFYLHIINDNNHGRNVVEIFKSGTPIASALVEGPEVKYDKDSAATVVRLAKGDTVYVKHINSPDTYLDGDWLCSFTGALLVPDNVTS